MKFWDKPRQNSADTHVVVGKREQGGKPFTEYNAPDGAKVRVWSPSVVREANRRAEAAIDTAIAGIREDQRKNGI